MGIEAKTGDLESLDIPTLREVLDKNDSMWITDLDDTIKESGEVTWQDGISRRVHPEAVIGVLALNKAGIRLGIATEQTFSEVGPFVTDIARLAVGSDKPLDVFNGLIIGEGGSVVYGKNGEQVVLAPKRAIEDKEKLHQWLLQNLVPTDLAGWFVLNGTTIQESTYVQLPPVEDIFAATISLWERGPSISVRPEFISKYKKIEDAVRGAMLALNISSLTTYEAGNGTLRIVPKFVNKAHSFELLSAIGALDLSSVVYSCDGPNDLKLAQKIVSMGGGVVAVANAAPELHNVATYSTTKTSGLGFAEAVSLVFPNEYQLAFREFSDKGLK